MADRPGSAYHYELFGGMEITVYPLLFGEGRVVIGPQRSSVWMRGYDYGTLVEAIEAAESWVETSKPPLGNYIRIYEGGV